ncbi:MAG: hypothetical protein E7674_04320 [Ruminococcaceae bacterium]|nr:hypothetical protein [Oscillospiraceae bacterium]
MKRALAVILLTLLLAAALVACNDTPEENPSMSDVSDSGEYVANVPEKDYKGEKIIFLASGVNETANSEILYNEYANGDENQIPEVVNDALRERANMLYEQYGLVLEEKYIYDKSRHHGDTINYMRDDLVTGAKSYHVAAPCLYDCAALAAEGILVDLLSGEIPYLDMSQPWWDQSFNSEMTLNGALYFTIGDIGITNKDATSCIAFNKNLIVEYGLDSPYDLVDNNEWTIDKVIEMSKTIKNDLNQDGKIDYQDQFGYGGQYDDMWFLFYASGERTASIGADGWPEITIYNERSVDVIENILELMQNRDYYVCANDYFGVVQWPSELVTQAFVEGRSIFNLSGPSSTSAYREMEDDFGLVPFPKYDTKQENYHTMVNPWTSNAFCVPIGLTEKQYEMVGIALEVMGAHSKNNLAVAYYDIALKYQKTRDDDTVRMLDIIFASRGCDIGMIYKWGNMDTMLHDLITKPAGSFTSTFESIKAKAESDMEKTIDFYESVQSKN